MLLEVTDMGFLSWILLGAIAGFIGRWIVTDSQDIGIIKTTLIGVAGALLAGGVGSLFGFASMGSLSFKGVLLASLGAVLILWLRQRMASRASS